MPPTDDLAALVPTLTEAFTSRKWTVLVGVVLAILIQAADKLDVLQWVPPGAKRWVAVAIAFVGSLGVGLAAGLPLPTIIGTSVSIALTAVGSYEVILKRFDKQPQTPQT